MLSLVTSRQFHKDVKRIKRQGKKTEKLKEIISLLANEIVLPIGKKDHKLTGIYNHHRECHIAPDWLLIYKTTPTELILERTGSHSELFRQ